MWWGYFDGSVVVKFDKGIVDVLYCWDEWWRKIGFVCDDFIIYGDGVDIG